jgi:hypothetical protein
MAAGLLALGCKYNGGGPEEDHCNLVVDCDGAGIGTEVFVTETLVDGRVRPLSNGDSVELDTVQSGTALRVDVRLPSTQNGYWKFTGTFHDEQGSLVAKYAAHTFDCPCEYQCPCRPVRIGVWLEVPGLTAPLTGTLEVVATHEDSGETHTAGPLTLTLIPP